MNLALGVLIILLIAIPGIVFRTTYLSSSYSKKWINTTAIDEVINSLLPAFIFHALFILIINLFHYTIDFQFIFNLIIGNTNAKDIDLLNVYLGQFLLYMLLNVIVNFGAAYYLRYLVLEHKWYKKVRFLGIYNEWYFKLKKPLNIVVPPGEELSVWVDVLVELKNSTILYRGFLTDFKLNKDGGLEELHLEDVMRRPFDNDQTEPYSNNASDENAATYGAGSRYYFIPGELFIIKYADVKNMNIWYLSETSDPE